MSETTTTGNWTVATIGAGLRTEYLVFNTATRKSGRTYFLKGAAKADADRRNRADARREAKRLKDAAAREAAKAAKMPVPLDTKGPDHHQ